MNVKKNLFYLFSIFLCAIILPGCGTTEGLVDNRTSLVWANAELYGRIRSSVEQLHENNRVFEERCKQFEQNNREFGNTLESLRTTVQRYIELCRFSIQTNKQQGEEISKLQKIIADFNSDNSNKQSDARGAGNNLYKTEN